MKKLLILLFCPIFGFCQQVQWVAKVIKSSSDLGGKQYSSRRVIGRPDVFPQGGDSPNAWAPKDAQDGHDFIEVEFAKAQTVKQIAIFENLNAGCLVKVMAGTGDGKYKEVFRNKIDIENWKAKYAEYNRGYYFSRKRRKVVAAPEVNVNPGIEYAVLEEPLENIKALRVVFNFKKTSGDKQIDAIGISDTDQPILPEINTKKDLENSPYNAQLLYSSKQSFTINALTKDKIYVNIDNDEDHSNIYALNFEGDKLSEPNLLSPSININENYNYIVAIIGDKFITGGSNYKKGTSESGFKFFKLNGANFGYEKPLEIAAYSNFDTTAGLCANKDASTILMTIESDITQGGVDVYYSKVKEDGTYSYLQNLGKVVNSANDEVNPFLCDDEKTLIFASNGRSSYGSMDLYFTIRLDDTWKNWSEPINLGPKINDFNSQVSAVYDTKNEILYFTSFKDDNCQLLKIKLPKSYLTPN
ncbi:hypothetical protein I5M32_15070 [Pedobacter sp. SD-b]|uniref:WD40-like Beta Propeller Repeat n=1 Tax=Pedobacter segetis TaxID=2793069 RepID=A0ABS1BN16_9SPHI|nr:hypothetical protein [Pedobacter segetis]MBK0384288.1 hypothetical protein [Pedobacter segetis]